MLLVLLACCLAAGCSPTQVKVSNAELGTEGHTVLNFAYAEDRRTTYSTEDEKVTFAVRLGYNVVGYYKRFRVHWIAPTGAVYLDAAAATAWGTHQALIAELPIRGTPAVRLPGDWRVRLLHEGEVLAEQQFALVDARELAKVAEAQQETAEAGDEPDAESSELHEASEATASDELVDAPPDADGPVLWVDLRRRLESPEGIAEVDALTDGSQ